MRLLILCFCAAVFCLLLAALYPLGRRSEEKQRRLNALREKEKQFRPEELNRPFAERLRDMLLKGLVGRVAGKKKETEQERKKNVKTIEMLAASGTGLEFREFAAIKKIVLLISAGAGALAFLLPLERRISLVVFCLVMCVGVLAPDRWLRSVVKRRSDAIRRDLPDVLDLLVVSLEAGLGFDSALLRLAEQKKGPLVEELCSVVREVQMGRNRRDCLRELSERTDVQELKTFVTAQIQAEQMGVSVRNIIKTQAENARLARKQRAQEKALKAPVKMMIPMVTLILPVLLIILLAPSILNLLKTLG